MVLNLEQLSVAYPHHLWLDFSEADREKSLTKSQDYSHDAARDRAFLNQLTLAVLLPILQAETPAFIKIANQENLWEFVSGFAVILDRTSLVIIPSEAIDTDEFSVPQEWVDIPEWAGDYYLAVQVNLEDGWLRVWGFTTHRKLKNQGRYDPIDRTYSLDIEDLFENLNSMWVARKFGHAETAEIQPLPTLSDRPIERLFAELSSNSAYSPRLKVPFAQWGAILASEDLRKQLYDRRIGKELLLTKVVNLSQNIFPRWWMSLEDLVRSQGVNFVENRSGYRSQTSETERNFQVQGRVIDLGIKLIGHPVVLILYFAAESDEKYNIILQLKPGGSQTYLLPDVELIVLDDTGGVFWEWRSRKADHRIQLEFTGETGEKFTVKVALGDTAIVEDFVI
jgi:Protein of unknown function (DUF1822)